MPGCNFTFLRDYVSAQGLTLEKTPSGYRLGNELSGRWAPFQTLAEAARHICTHH